MNFENICFDICEYFKTLKLMYDAVHKFEIFQHKNFCCQRIKICMISLSY